MPSKAIKLDDEIFSRLKALAEARQRTPHWLMKEAIRQFLEREEESEQLRRESLERWERFEATGETVSHEAVEAWAANLGDRSRGQVSKVLRWLPEAVPDLARLRDFIRVHNPDAAERAAKKILESVRKLATHPLIGRPVVDIDHPKLRDLFIQFGRTGYCLRYTVTDAEIIIVKIWHDRETRTTFQP